MLETLILYRLDYWVEAGCDCGEKAQMVKVYAGNAGRSAARGLLPGRRPRAGEVRTQGVVREPRVAHAV